MLWSPAFTQGQGSEPGSPCLCGKHFSDWTVTLGLPLLSLSLGLTIVCLEKDGPQKTTHIPYCLVTTLTVLGPG